MDSLHRGDFDAAAGGIPAMQQPQRAPVFSIISSVLVLLVNHRVHADGITGIGRRLRREGLRRLHLPFLLGIGIIDLPDANMIPSRVRVPDMIKRNIDNLPNPVAAGRLIRHQRKRVPVPPHARNRCHLAEPGREFRAGRRQPQRGHPPPDAGIIVHGPRVGHEAAFHGKGGIGRDIEIKGIGFPVRFENRPIGRRAIRQERITPDGKSVSYGSQPGGVQAVDR